MTGLLLLAFPPLLVIVNIFRSAPSGDLGQALAQMDPAILPPVGLLIVALLGLGLLLFAVYREDQDADP